MRGSQIQDIFQRLSYQNSISKSLTQGFNGGYLKKFIYKDTQYRVIIIGYKLMSLTNPGTDIS